jgi:hypothetical protein
VRLKIWQFLCKKKVQYALKNKFVKKILPHKFTKLQNFAQKKDIVCKLSFSKPTMQQLKDNQTHRWTKTIKKTSNLYNLATSQHNIYG